MSEMVERIAKVIAAYNGEGYGAQNFLEDARAVLEEIREPTDAMAEAGGDAYANGNPEDAISRYGLKDAWRRMIDAALAD
jgi:hypothetical protein